MSKEKLKATIKANFENNDFETAMVVNKELFVKYEAEAGKRSLTSIINYYRKKAEDAQECESIQGKSVEEQKDEGTDYKFETREAILDLENVKILLESDNKALKRYCIVKEEFKQISDTEQFIQTTMIVKPDGYGWDNFGIAVGKLGGKKGKTERKVGSFWKSEMGLPVGEEIIKYSIYKIDDALRKFAFRQNSSAITKVTTSL